MTEVRRQFGEGSQDKPAKVQTRMRHHYPIVARLVDDLIPIEEKIKVDRPGPLPIVKVSTETAFRLKQDLQESIHGQFRFYPRDQVKKRPAYIADRFGFIGGGIARQRASGEHTQKTQRAGAEVTPIPEIRTDADVGFNLWHTR
jgi:hypothetical protein